VRRRSKKQDLANAFASLAALLALGGCGNPQIKPEDRPPTATADGSLTVVGWSLRDQAPLPVRGALKAEGERDVATFDTRSDAASGKTFEHLAAGHYRIEVTQRYASDRSIAASGLVEVDIQPGEHVRREVVIDDRDPGAEGVNH
jgi:hypothetical protein